METVRSGPYLVRVGLYADPDLSPTNLGEAFDYYSAVPGWGWRAVIYAADGGWDVQSVHFGAADEQADYVMPDPEGELDSYFPCGRVVALADGGLAYEGGIAIPPRHLPGPDDDVAVWIVVVDESGSHGVEVAFNLVENESWDALEPRSEAVVARRPRSRRVTWSPVDEPTSAFRAAQPGYAEPQRSGLPEVLTQTASQAVALARDEALRLRRDRTGSEELLLGLLREGSSFTAAVLREAGIGLREARAAVQFLQTATHGMPLGPGAGLTPAAEKALRLAADEARKDGAARVESRHLLRGLLRQRGGASTVLNWLGASGEAVKSWLSKSAPKEEP